jgi:hypothetical protein
MRVSCLFVLCVVLMEGEGLLRVLLLIFSRARPGTGVFGCDGLEVFGLICFRFVLDSILGDISLLHINGVIVGVCLAVVVFCRPTLFKEGKLGTDKTCF